MSLTASETRDLIWPCRICPPPSCIRIRTYLEPLSLARSLAANSEPLSAADAKEGRAAPRQIAAKIGILKERRVIMDSTNSSAAFFSHARRGLALIANFARQDRS